jgi:oxygen-independent coproporphyrinogen-3 oxidase
MARGAQGLAPAQVVRASELPFEFMMNALRLIDGFSTALFEDRTGLHPHVIAERMQRLQTRGLVESEGSLWRPTRQGSRFLNEMLLEFIDMPREERPGLGRKTPA